MRKEIIEKEISALAGVTQWIEGPPASRKVAGSILDRSRAWVAGQVPSWGHATGDQLFLSHISVSLSFSLPFPLSKNK